MYQNIYYDYFTKTMHLWDDEEGYVKHENIYNYAYIEDSNGEFESITGKRLRLMVNPSKEYLDSGLLYEDRVPIHTRLLVDLYFDSDEVSKGNRVAFLDIEVAKEDGYSDPYNAENTVTAITIGLYGDDKYYTVILDRKNQLQRKVYALKDIMPDATDDINIMVIPCRDEHGLFREFIKLYRELSPTILSGWNIFGYDIPYLITRMEKVLGEGRSSFLSPIGICRLDEFRGEKRIIIAGVSVLDYLDLYKKFTYNEQSSYALGNIADIELGQTKVEYEGGLDELLALDIFKFLAYNIIDVHLVALLETKLNYIEIARGICHKGRVPYESIFKTSHYMEGAILSLLKSKNKVAPKRYEAMVSGKAHGAYVKLPLPGIYTWVYDLDLTSLYPSNIMSLNISPETKVAKITNWVVEGFKSSQEFISHADVQYELQFFDGYTPPTTVSCRELHEIMQQFNLTLSANGVIYDNSKKGLLSTILEIWFAERAKFSKMAEEYFNSGDMDKYKFFDKKQLIQKIMLNSLYGVLLLPSFRFYDRDNGEAVTITGQQISWFTREVTNAYYSDIIGKVNDYCIYGDTDSVFYPAMPLIDVLFPNATDDEKPDLTIQIASDVEEYINKMYDEYAANFHGVTTHRWNIKQELVAKSAFWGDAKKRYAMWIVRKKGLPVNKPDIKGFDVVKSDFPKAYKILMTDVLHGILHQEGASTLNHRIVTAIEKYANENILSIMKPTGISNLTKWVDEVGRHIKGTPVHVKSSINYNRFISDRNLKDYPAITNGDKVYWCYLKPNPEQFETISIPVSNVPEEVLIFVRKYIDIDRMTETTLLTKLQKIWTSLGWGNLVLKSNLFKYFSYE